MTLGRHRGDQPVLVDAAHDDGVRPCWDGRTGVREVRAGRADAVQVGVPEAGGGAGEGAGGAHVLAQAVDDAHLGGSHLLVVFDAAADEDLRVGEDGAFGRRQQGLDEHRRGVSGIDLIASGGTRGGRILLADGVVRVRDHVEVTLCRQVDRQGPRGAQLPRAGQGRRQQRERRREGAVGLEVAPGDAVLDGDLDVGHALVVGGRAGQVEVQALQPGDGAGDVQQAVWERVTRHLCVDGQDAAIGSAGRQADVVGRPDGEGVRSWLQVEGGGVRPVVAGGIDAERGDAVEAGDDIGAPIAVAGQILTGGEVAQ